jgi:glycerol uptake facilitator-like aquaporin
MDPRLRAYLAELVGTFFVVFFAAGAVCVSVLTTEPRLDVAAIALAGGLALGVALTATFHVSSGCLNPAITLMLWVFKRLPGGRALALIGVQLAGAVLAGLVLRLLFADDVLRQTRLGAPHLQRSLAEGRVTFGALLTGAGVEVLFTALVAFAVFGTLLDRRGPKLGGFGVGLAQVAVVAVGYRLTGGCANPARWFGPAVWTPTVPGLWDAGPLADHAVYWAGPMLGALLGGLLYGLLIGPPER